MSRIQIPIVYLFQSAILLILGFSTVTFAANGPSDLIATSRLGKCVYPDGEVVVQNQTIDNGAPIKPCGADTQEINLAKEVIKKYWVSSRKEQYDLLSKRYKTLLKQAYKIDNAHAYSRNFSDGERIWARQTYQRAAAYANQRVEFVVLGHWLEEGYDGVTTFNFDMVNERGAWKIDYIMY